MNLYKFKMKIRASIANKTYKQYIQDLKKEK